MTDKKETKVVKKTTKPVTKKTVAKKPTVKKVAPKKTSKSEAKRLNLQKAKVDTFDDWWNRNYKTFSNVTLVLVRELGIKQSFSALRKKFGMSLNEKQLCEKIWKEYK